jgi:hypothetical protein
MCTPTIEKHGATPAYIQWTVVRGDTAKLNVQFLEDDETTPFDADGWEFRATAYDPNGDVLDELEVEYENEWDITIVAPASITENWGSSYRSVVAELPFDLQVIIPETGEDTVWTPVIGKICVLGDMTPGGSL